MTKTYQLTTIKDIFDKVPADRIETCLMEMARNMLYAKNLGDLIGAPIELREPFEWVDDGKEDQTITIHDQKGDHALTFKASKTP